MISGQDHVCLKVVVTEDAILLKCKIDLTGLDVHFFSPNNTLIGSCSPPPLKEFRKETFVDCGNNITQYYDEETSVLRLEKLSKWIGEWTCKHGSAWSSDNVNITECMVESIQECNCDKETPRPTDGININGDYEVVTLGVCFQTYPYLVLFILTPLAIAALFFIWQYRQKYKENEGKGQDNELEQIERLPLVPGTGPGIELEQTEDTNLAPGKGPDNEVDQIEEDAFVTRTALEDIQSKMQCTKCNQSCNMMCINCKTHYCIACLKVHLDTKEHIVTTLENAFITRGTFNTKCEVCKDNLAKEYCIIHEHLVCTSCKCFNMQSLECNRTKILLPLSHETKRFTSANDVTYEKSFKISESQKDLSLRRVCGIIAVPQNTILLADTQNQELLWYANYEFKRSFALCGEPVALVCLFDSHIAMSFPQQRTIIEYIFEENKTELEKGKEIDLQKFGKPCSLAYSNGFYAVELGKGDSGYIGIFQYDKGNFVKKISIDYGYFTGCTIRLAMDNKSETLFVSAVGIKKILCINRTTGEGKWSAEMPSPRAILFFSADLVGYETLLVANKRSDVIYKVNPNDRKREVFLFENGLSGPRFMAYDKCSKFLYVYSDHEIIHVYKYPCQNK